MAVVLLLRWWRSTLLPRWTVRRWASFKSRFCVDRWTATPVVIMTTWTVFADHPHRWIFLIDIVPVMILTVDASSAHFFEWWPSIPIVVTTIWTIFTNNFLIHWVKFHFFHVVFFDYILRRIRWGGFESRSVSTIFSEFTVSIAGVRRIQTFQDQRSFRVAATPTEFFNVVFVSPICLYPVERVLLAESYVKLRSKFLSFDRVRR